MDRRCLIAIVITYLVLSFMPGLGLMALMGKGKGKKG